MSKHTPGPWHLAPMNGMGGCREIRGPHRKEGLAGTVGLRDDDEDAANAALIAAAPELLDFLHALERHCTGEVISGQMLHAEEGQALRKRMRALIAKAEGRS